MSPIVYGDFTCAACYLASRRADLLFADQHPVDWRAVEHHPGMPLTGKRLAQQEREQMDREWSSVLALLRPGEDLPGRPPSFLASTRAAVAGYAEAYGAGVAERARRLLFHAYWVDGQDIGHPDVLRVLLAAAIRSGHSTSEPLREWGYAVSPARGPLTSVGYHLILDWRQQWHDLGQPCEPTLLDSTDGAITGSAALAELGDLVSGPFSEHPELDPLPKPQSSGRFWL